MAYIPVGHPPGHGDNSVTMFKIAPGDFVFMLSLHSPFGPW
ncbi:MAG: hypothetical protein OQK47_06910 [Gammaproteobacteria bacterium]|nr:hypothetical protein [Gammaproteobacteria bacterium]